ncbi:LamG-like jellyroll fold domain-containing protein [Nonlabens tegetincola]|uniref:LamG-like jellyroll fold domain-containing protein n=1 Tax=Nonlabens tegetincola TaxID=323273 RepID=UPI000CF3D50F|nr:LamG-like jellyroll fold domain-containing protein [Nonlabens tegetincola]PQJ18633.1 hypothetical protein BST93_09130 [Nonlabens tegetincola]
MKKFYLILVLLSGIANAQVTIFNADFTTGLGDNAWTDAANRGQWRRGSDLAAHGVGFYKYIRRTRSNVTYEEFARMSTTTPLIDLSGYERMVLSFRYNLDVIPNGADGFRIEFDNNDGLGWRTLGRVGEPDSVNWMTTDDASAVGGYGAWANDSNGWTTASVNLPSQAFDDQSDVRFRVWFQSDGAAYSADGLAIDDFRIEGYLQLAKVYVDCGNGVGPDLELWLNPATLADNYNDGDLISEWRNSVAIGNVTIDGSYTNATSSGSQRPIYQDNAAANANYNPVVSFDGSKSMFGKGGFYYNDIYVVINPTQGLNASRGTEDVFMGDDYNTSGNNQDVTGISINNTSNRYGTNPDIVAYNQGAQNDYGKAIVHPTLNYDRPVIFNVRVNDSGDGMELYLDGVNLENIPALSGLIQEVNSTTIKEILNSRYWLGRSEFFGSSFNGDILEIMSFSEKKSDDEREKIESYFAMKYGITLGLFPIDSIGLPHVPGSYYDSSGNELWNASIDPGFTYNVTAIGRDDCMRLNQKQARSIDPNAFVSVGLGDLYNTNNANPNTFEDDYDFLVWGSTSEDLDPMPSPLAVTLGPDLVTTFTDVTKRTWKFKEVSEQGNDIPEVKVIVETAGFSSLPALVGNDAYVMIVANDENFNDVLETIFLDENGATLETTYDFDGEKYVKFGVAHEEIEPRHIDFDGENDYVQVGNEIQLNGAYSISAWVLSRGANSDGNNRTIVSKKGTANNGYWLFLDADNRVSMRHQTQTRKSNTRIADNVWTYITVVYNGTSINFYIDGVLDKSQNIAALTTNSEDFCIGARYISKTDVRNQFYGNIDEVRIFTTAINQDQIRFMMNQEIEEFGGGIKGAIIPSSVTKNDIAALSWSNLEAYYNMNTYIGTHLNDASGNKHRGSLRQPSNFTIIDQTAPLPYISQTNGDFSDNSTWQNGGELYNPGSTRVVAGAVYDIDWNIVQSSHNIEITDKNITLLGLNQQSNELSVKNDLGLTVTHILELDGLIDLEGEAQLIQTLDSDLIGSSTGSLEADQQGTSDKYNYNYWSSPVSSTTNALNNDGYTIQGFMHDGTFADNPRPMNFTSRNVRDGAPGTASTAATISGRWLYKYSNLSSGNYSNWEYVGPTGSLKTGEGFTMKGNSDNISGEQNYVFIGRPNNGFIDLPINNGNDYLVGNPYPSALDAHEFIRDNPQLDGTLYFWEHWGGNSHVLLQYQGGYATYNFSGGVPNASIGTSSPQVNQGGVPTKTPEQFVPVAQGFFVRATSNGTVRFENDQRQFIKESTGPSVFVAAPGSGAAAISPDLDYNGPNDTRQKIRLGFDSPGTIHRQLLVTEDVSATMGYDRGFDAKQQDNQMDDMSWYFGGDTYVIQGVGSFDNNTILPLSVKISNPGTITIGLDNLENVNQDLNIFLHDNLTGMYHNLRNADALIDNMSAGTVNDRFELVFNDPSTLSNNTVQLDNQITIYQPVNTDQIHVKVSNELLVNGITLYNTLGQKVVHIDSPDYQDVITIDTNEMSAGAYIVTIDSNSGSYSEKVIVK